MRNVAFGILVSIVSPLAAAQEFPTTTVRIVVPYGSGGAPDLLARMLAQRMTETLGKPVIVDNRPGASGIVAAEHVARSAADGHTIFLGDTGHLAINPSLRLKLPYDPLKDFAPVAQLIYSPFFLFAHASLGVQNVQELVALAKKKPGLNYGSSGNGSPHHLCMSLLGKSAGVELTHVPYKGVAQSIPALTAGEVTLMCTSPLTGMPVVRAGKALVLAVAAPQRSGVMPDVPTVREAGFADVESGATVGLLAPAGTPKGVIERLSAEALAVVREADAKQKLQSLGQDIIPAGPGANTKLASGTSCPSSDAS